MNQCALFRSRIAFVLCSIIVLSKNSVKLFCYRPQRSWGKVMFYACLWLCSQGVGAIPAYIAGGIPVCLAAGLRGGVSRPTPRGKLRGLARGVSRPTPGRGVCIPACTEADTPLMDGYCHGHYASYWNAFLFSLHIHSMSEASPSCSGWNFGWKISVYPKLGFGPQFTPPPPNWNLDRTWHFEFQLPQFTLLPPPQIEFWTGLGTLSFDYPSLPLPPENWDLERTWHFEFWLPQFTPHPHPAVMGRSYVETHFSIPRGGYHLVIKAIPYVVLNLLTGYIQMQLITCCHSLQTHDNESSVVFVFLKLTEICPIWFASIRLPSWLMFECSYTYEKYLFLLFWTWCFAHKMQINVVLLCHTFIKYLSMVIFFGRNLCSYRGNHRNVWMKRKLLDILK